MGNPNHLLPFWLGVVRLTVTMIYIIVCMPVQLVWKFLGLNEFRLPLRLFYSLLTRGFLGIRIETRGELHRAAPTLLLGNHLSHMDILVLGALVPAAFVSKAEVAKWPIFGWQAWLQGTVFIDRSKRHEAQAQGQRLAKLLHGGRNLVLFPEGTSTDGHRLLPFKTSILAGVSEETGAANSKPIMVQPFSLAVYGQHGQQELYPYHGDHVLMPHLLQLMRVNSLRVVVTFHPPFPARECGDRKILAVRAYDTVASAPYGVLPEAAA